MNSVILGQTLGMIDRLKTVCANYGLANDSSEYKIITESFLYKYLNDRMLYALGQLDEFADCDGSKAVEERYARLGESDRELVNFELGNIAIVRPEWMVATLYNQSGNPGFAKVFDKALLGIAQDNMDAYAVKAGAESITLFQGVSRFIVEENKRDEFCGSLILALADFSFAGAFSQGYDFFSQVFEYLIKDYNKDSGSYGEYFTPHAIASIMARILVPDGDRNVTVYDPAAGSGTLVLALAHQIGEGNCTVYTQDRSQKANEFMRLNLILNGMVGSLANVVHDDTLMAPRHLDADGSLKRFDYIVSNPPFKCDFSDTRDALAGEKYAKRFWAGVPNVPAKQPEKMAIYLMFIQHILYSLKDGGKAAIVVPTGFLTAKSRIELAIRTKIIESGMLRGVISMPSNIFANTGTNVSILFLDSSRQYDDALLMDASKLGTKEKVGKNHRTVLSDEEIERIIGVFNDAREEDGFSVLASYESIKSKRYSFSAGQYFEVKIEYTDITPEQFQSELAERMCRLRELWAEGDRLQQEIEERMKAVHIA